MGDALEGLKLLDPVLTDAWCLMDAEDKVVQFNAAFFNLFPKPVARKLKGSHCKELMRLPGCGDGQCLAVRCRTDGPQRMDEVEMRIGQEQLRIILTTAPVALPDGVGMLLVLRNVTDEARVQGAYQQLVDESLQQRRGLEQLVEERTRDLLATNEALTRKEEELAQLRREYLLLAQKP